MVVVCIRLKGLMAENDMSIKKLAETVGISPKSLQRKINGRTHWSFNELTAIKMHLNALIQGLLFLRYTIV